MAVDCRPGRVKLTGEEIVMSRNFVSTLALVCLLGLLTPGCAIPGLKEANQRLKEQNDRLVSENNLLQQDLATARGGPIQGVDDAEITPERKAEASDLLIPDESGIGSGVEIERTAEGIKMTIPQRVFFQPGKTELTGSGKGILQKIAQVLNGNDYGANTVRVEGHTDNVPVNKVRARYPSNWELSTARACTVVRYLVDSAGVGRARIYPAGFADTRPVASGNSVDSRQKNRRVEITILNQGA